LIIFISVMLYWYF